MMKPILLGAALSLVASSAAWANPTATSGQQGAQSSNIVKVGRGDYHDRDRHWKGNRWDDHHAFRDHDDRYRGWKRYSYRPYDWEGRGCISVGPIWYCS